MIYKQSFFPVTVVDFHFFLVRKHGKVMTLAGKHMFDNSHVSLGGGKVLWRSVCLFSGGLVGWLA